MTNDPHTVALDCIAYLRGRRGIYEPRPPRLIVATEADKRAAAAVRAEALAPEPLPPDDDDLTAARARVAVERAERIAHPRHEKVLTRAGVIAIMRGRDWLHIADVCELLRCAGLAPSVSTVKRRLLEAVAYGQAERRGTNSTSTMYRAKEDTQGA